MLPERKFRMAKVDEKLGKAATRLVEVGDDECVLMSDLGTCRPFAAECGDDRDAKTLLSDYAGGML
eukprot:2494271-Rhodomonas_salina.1